MPKDVGAKHFGERRVWGLVVAGQVWVAARLRQRGPADARALVCGAGDGAHEVGQNVPHRGGPVDADEAANAGIEHDGVELGH